MSRILRILLFGLIGVIFLCGFSFLFDKAHLANWEVSRTQNIDSEISWAKFIWTSDTLGGKYFEKTAMVIPCRIIGLPYNFTFQFDLGADITGLYENNINSFIRLHPTLKSNIKRLKSPLQFWNSTKTFENLKISFGDYTASNYKSYLYSGYGDNLTLDILTQNDTFPIGTIGADLFQGKVLIIDYPNQKFAICETVPLKYKKNLIDIETETNGRVILPLKIKGNNYRIMFDNGSSLFPIITTSINRSKFSKNPVIDSIEISSWGQKHIVDSRMITDTFELAGKMFSNIKVYENHTNKGIDLNTDGMTGNYLFWNSTIIIDFKNKRFGVD